MSVIISSRCGIRCDECHYLTDGLCSGKCCEISKPFWGDTCPVKSCCEGKHLQHCCQCPEFPCEQLHSYAYDPEQGDNGQRLVQCRKWREEA